jgi:hypothetical protein
MAQASSSNADGIRRSLRGSLAGDPQISLRDAATKWRIESGQPMNEAVLSQIRTIYAEERSARSISDPPLQRAPRTTNNGWRKGAAILGNILVGLGTQFALLLLVTGSLLNALGVLALAVICTAGVSLIPILGIAWLIGWVVVTPIRMVLR